MVNKYLLGLKRYLMRKVSVCTSKFSRLGSVYKLTAQRSQGSDLRFQPILWKHDNHTILYDFAKQKQNDCSLDLTSLFHHTIGFMLLAYVHWEKSTSWAGKTDNWLNVLCSYDLICAQIMVIKTWYFQNWDCYMCGFLITSTTSDCAIIEKYVSKHVNLVISGAVKTLVECNWVTSVQLVISRLNTNPGIHANTLFRNQCWINTCKFYQERSNHHLENYHSKPHVMDFLTI